MESLEGAATGWQRPLAADLDHQVFLCPGPVGMRRSLWSTAFRCPCASSPAPARCRRFRGEASFGKDFVIRQTFYGFRLHVRLCWPGVISRIVLAPANIWEPTVVPELAEQTLGLLVGDRNYDAPRIAAELAEHGVELLAPPRHKSRDPHPSWNLVLSHVRYRIDTVFGQLTERFRAKRVWARDSWHLWSRLLRKVLSHTLALLLNRTAPDRLQLACLLSQ